MFYQYFPGNYAWSGSFMLALEMGGRINEIHGASKDLIEIAKEGGERGTEAFLEAWGGLAEDLIRRGELDEAAGHTLSAAAKFKRATVYYMIAERLQSKANPKREPAYDRMQWAFAKAMECGGEACERVEIPYEGSSYPAIFFNAAPKGGRAPAVVFCNGLDSVKEWLYYSGVAHELAARGISTLIVDQPGTGEALRRRGLIGRYDSEAWATPALEYLLTRPEVDPDRIAMAGLSLGGYFAPRAVAFEKRFKLCVSWGANYDWGETQKRRLANQGDRPVPHYWEHVQWVFGFQTRDDFMAFAPKMTLAGVIDKVTVPYLIVHGELDTQIPMEDAHAQYAGAINSPDRELRVVTKKEGGAMHASADNKSIGNSIVCDWIADRI